jgi:MFS family permease
LDLIGFGIVIPILPFYAEKFGASATVLGLLLASYAAMQFLFAPFWGKLSDRIGRKNVLLITLFGSGLGLALLGLAPSLPWIFAGRILSGIFAANIGVASAYVTDVTDEANRAKGMGLIGAAFGIGFILGPALGGILSTHGYSTPILFAAGLSFVNVGYAKWRLIDVSRSHEKSEKPPSTAELLSDPFIRKLCLTNLLFTLGVTQLEAVFAFFMKDRFGYDARHVAYILVFMALIMVGIQGGLIKRLVMRFGERRLLWTGALLLAIAFFSIPKIFGVALLLLPLAVASVGRGVSQPSLLSLVSKGAFPNQRGSVMGIFQSSASLARVIGPAAAGWLYDGGQALPFFLAGTLMAAVVLLGLGIRVPHSETFPFSGKVDVVPS